MLQVYYLGAQWYKLHQGLNTSSLIPEFYVTLLATYFLEQVQ